MDEKGRLYSCERCRALSDFRCYACGGCLICHMNDPNCTVDC